MDNPRKILTTLDGFLNKEIRLILYGRAALVLAYENVPPEYAATMDVDAILPLTDIPGIELNDDFWSAVESTNSKLEPSGLYLTHLFTEDQVILSENWLDDIASIPFRSRHLNLFRPSTNDLILTKMMRVDPQDRSDITFLLQQDDADLVSLRQMVDRAIIPDIPELHEAFQANLEWLKTTTAETKSRQPEANGEEGEPRMDTKEHE